MGADIKLRFEHEPLRSWTPTEFDAFLVWATAMGASDVALIPGSPVWIRLHGIWLIASQRRVTTDEISALLDYTSRNPSASAQVKGGEDQDYAYEIKIDRASRRRFRVNATGCRDGWNFGMALVLRTIPAIPPTLEEIGVEREILDSAFPNNGLVLVTGVMGSGKSTLLAAMLRHIRQHQARNILTYEAPIEFDLMDIPNPCGPLVQSAIPEHLRDFVRAPRNAARRAADVILVGESRDPETLRGLAEAAEIGVAAYSTVHTRSVSETPSRIINVFPGDLQNQVASTLLASLRLIIQQRLVPARQGGRVALREFLVFTAEHREHLFQVPLSHLIPEIEQLVQKDGQPLVRDARRKFEAGLIDEDHYRAIEHEREKTHVA